MQAFDYKVIPAPKKGAKGKGIRGAEAQFAHGLEQVLGEMAGDGWEFLRSETLPAEERSGLSKTVSVWRTVLVFRRARLDVETAYEPRLLESPKLPDPKALAPVRSPSPFKPVEKPAAEAETGTEESDAAAEGDMAETEEVKLPATMVDNGVEDAANAEGVANLLAARAKKLKAQSD